ncbi:MAG: insulinase family protein, partial [Myxococcota bacterium]
DRRGPDLFSFYGQMAAGHAPEEARERIYRELESVAERGITERELAKARNRVRSYFLFGMQSNMSRARQLAEFELYFGDAALARDELARYLAVTADDVKRVAGTYFPATNRTVLDVVPATGAAEANE